MSNKRPLPIEPLFSVHERYEIFKATYGNELVTGMSKSDQIFKKSFKELSEKEKCKFSRYAIELELEEKEMIKIVAKKERLEEDERIGELIFEKNKNAFYEKFKHILSENEIKEFCDRFRQNLDDLLNGTLTKDQIDDLKDYATVIIENIETRNQFVSQLASVKQLTTQIQTTSSSILYPLN